MSHRRPRLASGPVPPPAPAMTTEFPSRPQKTPPRHTQRDCPEIERFTA